MFFLLFVFLFIFLSLLAVIIMQGLRKIPANPPTVGVRTWLGKRRNRVDKEGWHFYLLYPWIESFVSVDVTKKERVMSPIQVRTPDMAPIEIHVSYTFSPDAEDIPANLRELPEYTDLPHPMINYLNSGGENGIKSIMDNVIDEAIRERVIDPHNEPRTWKEAVGMQRKLLSEVVEKVIGQFPEELDCKKIEAELIVGNGKLRFYNLGFKLNRLNVTKVHPAGGVVEAAERKAVEEAKMEGDEVKTRNLIDKVTKIQSLGFKPEQALEAFQVEQGDKLTKSISETKFNLSNETRDFFKESLLAIGGMVQEGFRAIEEAVKSKKGA